MRSNAAKRSNGSSIAAFSISMIGPARRRAAGADRIGAELLAPEDERSLGLGDLERRDAYAAGIGGGPTGQAVIVRPRPVPQRGGAGHAETVIAALATD